MSTSELRVERSTRRQRLRNLYLSRMDARNDLFADLEHDSAVVFSLDRSLLVVYCNAAWDAFARENGGAGWERPSPYGRSLLDVIPDRLKGLHRTAYLSVFLSGTSWTHHYECSSPEVYRLFRMTVNRSPGGDFLTVANSLVTANLHSASRQSARASNAHRGAGDSVRMCCVCRRTSRVADQVWDWVPEYVKVPPKLLVHGLCESCMDAAPPPNIPAAEGGVDEV